MEYLIFLLIMVAKIVEVSMATVRTVLITKGERTIASAIGFFEVMLWIYIASAVLGKISENPMKAIFYALGFAIGNYVGCVIEEKLAIGLTEVQIIVSEETGVALIEYIRECGFAVTVVRGEGRTQVRSILYIFTPRKRVNELVEVVKRKDHDCVIAVSDTKHVHGGFGIMK